MTTEKEIRKILEKVIHPETRIDIVSSGVVKRVDSTENGVFIELGFQKKKDPFSNSIKRQITDALAKAGVTVPLEISIAQHSESPAKQQSATGGIKHIVAIASGKGGVGKSTVTANLAVTLNRMGYKVGILDADIYGPSMPKMFGVENYIPEAITNGNEQYIIPADVQGVKIMSIGFFISPDDALVWRGPMANSALKQLIHQTMWEDLDYLLVDLPPGTGDVHLSVMSELKIDGAVIVSTPQQVAIADVKRGIKMFQAKGLEVPVLGLIENMAWFSPAELPDNKYYIFGHGGARNLARMEGIDLLGEIPIIQSVMESGDNGNPAAGVDSQVMDYYRKTALKIVDKLNEKQ